MDTGGPGAGRRSLLLIIKLIKISLLIFESSCRDTRGMSVSQCVVCVLACVGRRDVTGDFRGVVAVEGGEFRRLRGALGRPVSTRESGQRSSARSAGHQQPARPWRDARLSLRMHCALKTSTGRFLRIDTFGRLAAARLRPWRGVRARAISSVRSICCLFAHSGRRHRQVPARQPLPQMDASNDSAQSNGET
jgi:hypothetical protein